MIFLIFLVCLVLSVVNFITSNEDLELNPGGGFFPFIVFVAVKYKRVWYIGLIVSLIWLVISC